MDIFDRNAVLGYVYERYGTSPEYLWQRFPGYAVLRQAGEGKWYAVIMDVPRVKLGIDGEGSVDILNVKVRKEMVGSLLLDEGIYPAYHMSKSNWVSVLLDGTVPREDVTGLIDMSFGLVGGKKLS